MAKIWLAGAAIALGLMATPASAFGDGTDSDKPIEYSAEHSEIIRDGVAVLTGDVVLVQGETRLKCDRLTLYFHNSKAPKPGTAAKPSGVYRYEAEGNVLATAPDETASGDKAVFEVDKKTITMTGPVVLTRGQNVMRGARLVIETATGHSVLDPEKSGRVKGLFVPEKKDDKGAKPGEDKGVRQTGPKTGEPAK